MFYKVLWDFKLKKPTKQKAEQQTSSLLVFFIDSYIFLISLVLLSLHLTILGFVYSLSQMQTVWISD